MTTRRELLRLVAVGSAAAAIGEAFGCGDNLDGRDAAAAVVEAASDGFLVVIWARVARSARVTVRQGDRLVTRDVAIAGSRSANVAIGGLAPAAAFEVWVRTNDRITLGPFAGRTAPLVTDVAAVRIAVFADVDPNPEFASDLCAQVVAAAPDLLVSIGDFPYTDNGPPATTVAAYRARHAEIRSHPPIRELLACAPLRAMYDDHEFTNNWDAAAAAAEPERLAAALAVWDEFFPVRDAAAPAVRYRSWRWGAHVECFLLDCRRYRSANAAPDTAGKTMLGAAQLAWLVDGLARSTVPFKLVLTTVPLGHTLGDDHWGAFATERAQLFAAIAGIAGILFVTADQHFFAAYRHDRGVREIQVGPLARGLGVQGPDEPGVLFRARRYNVGLFDITADRLVVTGLGADGEHFYSETLTAADLTPT